jgi:hypothetical protein
MSMMGKGVRWVLAVVMPLSMSLSSFDVGYAGELHVALDVANLIEGEQTNTAASAFDPHRLANLDVSRELYLSLLGSFGQSAVLEAEDCPDWYGGSYMDDGGKLVICVATGLRSGEQIAALRVEIAGIVGSDGFRLAPCGI